MFHRLSGIKPVNEASSRTKHSLQSSAFEAALQHISECRSIYQKLDVPSSDASDPTLSLLALYEFEARLHLGHPNLESVLDQAAALPLAEPKTFETIAG